MKIILATYLQERDVMRLDLECSELIYSSAIKISHFLFSHYIHTAF